MVITGLSGSGKSSLAFDTLFAEGQRREIVRGSREIGVGEKFGVIGAVDGHEIVVVHEAEAEARTAVGLEPKAVPPRLLLARVYTVLGRPEEGEKQLKELNFHSQKKIIKKQWKLSQKKLSKDVMKLMLDQ